MRRLGVGFRRELEAWLATRPPQVTCLEVTAEHFFDGGRETLRALRRDYPLMVHGLGLSLGTPGPLDADTLERFAGVVADADPVWISEHVAFTRSDDVDLGHLNPVAPDDVTLDVLAAHARELTERCRRPLLLENITSHLRLPGTMSEPEFLNRLCERAGCGLLLDVTNLYINARNHGFDPLAWLRGIEPRNIIQLHVVGYSMEGGRWMDLHAEPVQDDLLALLTAVVACAPVQAVVLERDARFPSPAALDAELVRLEAAVA